VPGQQQVRVDPAQRVQRGERLAVSMFSPDGMICGPTRPVSGFSVAMTSPVSRARRLSNRIAALPWVWPGACTVLAGLLDQVEVRDAARQPVDALAHLHWLAFP
jgi:hypothetical protein